MKKVLKITGIGVLALVVIAVAGMMFTGITPLSWGMHSSVFAEDGVALNGYDVVSYFDGTPVEGRDDYQSAFAGVTWKFATAEHKAAFDNEPEKYKPANGGYCAKAVSTGFAAPADPEIWEVYDGTLYIFSNKEIHEEFLKDPVSMVSACQKTWTE